MSSFDDGVIEQFRANGGRVQGFGDALVLVHHVGAKTGTERIAPLMAMHPDDDTWLIAGSKGGAPDHPSWFHNLLAHPDVTIETPQGEVSVRATELKGADRDAAWSLFTERSRGFADYQEKTTRVIPVVQLTRR